MELIKKKSFLNISEKRDKFLYCVIVTVIIGLIAHAYQFFHSSFSHDSLNALYSDMTEIKWKLALGRFVVPLIMKIRGQIALPWLIGIVSLFLIAASLYLILETLQIDSKAMIILVSIFMVTNRTIYSMTATFIYELDYDMLALFFASLAAYILMKKDKPGRYLLAFLSGVISLGLYQSYIEVAFAIVIIASLKNLLEGSKYSQVLKRGIIAIVSFVLSVVAYYLIYKLSCKLFNVQIESRTDAFSGEHTSIIVSLKVMLYKLIHDVVKPGTIYELPIVGIADILLIAIGVALCLIMIFKLGKGKTGEKVVSLLLLAALPLSLNLICLTIKSGSEHDLMTYSFNFLYIFALVMIYMFNREKNIKSINIVAVALCAIIGFNNVVVSNTFYLKKDMEKTATVSLMTRVVDDLEERDDYSVGVTPVMFIGVPEVFSIYEGFDLAPELPIGLNFRSSFYQSSRLDIYNSYKKFFTYYLNYPINYSEKNLTRDERVKAMPTYPNKGYIQNIDGVLVVKFE